MKAFVEFVVKALVDHPEEVDVREVDGERVVVFELRLNQGDIGKVRKRQGFGEVGNVSAQGLVLDNRSDTAGTAIQPVIDTEPVALVGTDVGMRLRCRECYQRLYSSEALGKYKDLHIFKYFRDKCRVINLE